MQSPLKGPERANALNFSMDDVRELLEKDPSKLLISIKNAVLNKDGWEEASEFMIKIMKEYPKSFDILKSMALAPNLKIRGFTAFTLSKLEERDDEKFELLIRLLKDREPEVWQEASSSIGGIASKNKKLYNYVMEISNDDFYELRKRGTRTLGEIAETDIQALGLLQSRIVDENKEVREEAIRVLGSAAKSKDEAVQILKNLIIHFPVSTFYGYDDIYKNAIKALSEAYQTKDEISVLKQLLEEKDKFIRLEAANAVGKAAKENAKAFSLLKELIKHEDEYVRRGIAKSLKELAETRPIETLKIIKEMISDEDRYVSMYAASALGVAAQKEEKAFELIQELLLNKSIKTLENLEKKQSEYILRGVSEGLVTIATNKKALSILKRVARDKDYYLRSNAAQALAKIAATNDDIFPIIKELAEDKDEYVRRQSAFALGALGKRKEEVIPLIKKLADDSDTGVRRNTAKILSSIASTSPKEVYDIVNKFAKDKDVYVQREAASSISSLVKEMPEQSFNLIMKLTTSDDEAVRFGAAMSLEEYIDIYPNNAFDKIIILIMGKCNPDVFYYISKMARRPIIGEIFESYYRLSKGEDIEASVKKAASCFKNAKQLEWGKELFLLYTIYSEALEAKSVEDIFVVTSKVKDFASIQYTPNQTLIEGFTRLTNIYSILLKNRRVDEPGDKQNFLRESIEAIDDIHNFIEENLVELEKKIFKKFFSNWKDILSREISSLKGRATLNVELRTKKVIFEDKTHILLGISNIGRSEAENVTIKIKPSSDFSVVEKPIERLDIIPFGRTFFIEFPVKARVKGRVRVVFVIEYDDVERKGKIFEFADVIEFIEAKKEKEFKPIETPYVVGIPIKSKEMFFGRREIFNFVRDNLKKFTGNVLVLRGQRRTGKTSILLQLAQTKLEGFIPVYIDLQGLIAGTNTQQLFYKIADKIWSKLDEEKIEIESPKLEEYEHPFIAFDKFLDRLEKKIGKKRVVLLIDEYEIFEYHTKEGRISSDIFGYFRNLMQHRDTLGFIFTGTHELEELSEQYWSVFFNIAIHKEIGFLDEESAVRLIKRPVEGLVEYDDIVVEKILAVTGKYPYFIQLICYSLVNYLNEKNKNYATITDLNTVLQTITKLGRAHFQFLWDQSSKEEKLVLSVMSQLLGYGKETTTLDEIHETLTRSNVDITKRDIFYALKKLCNKRVIAEVRDVALYYHMEIDLVRTWVQQNKPLLRVLIEGDM